MPQRNKATFEKRRREIEQKKRKADKREKKLAKDATPTQSTIVNDDPWANQGIVIDLPERGR